MENKNLQQAMAEYLDRVAEIMVQNLFENGSVASGALAKSIQNDNDVVRDQNGDVTGELSMLDYGEDVDSGFKFRGTGGIPPEKPIKDWIQRKRITKPAKFKDVNSWIWAIRKSIGKKVQGRRQTTRAYPFIDKSFEAAQKFGTDILTQATGKDITATLNVAFQDSTKL